jgi:uncharacterized membrane protein
MDDPVDNIANYKWGIFYYNRSDIRTVVPKRVRAFGWSLNFARWGSYAFLLIILGFLVLSSVFKGW